MSDSADQSDPGAEQADKRALIAELSRRTSEVAAASERAVEGLPDQTDELTGAIIERMRDVSEECERIHGILESVALMLEDASVPDSSETSQPEAEAVPSDDFVDRPDPEPVAYPGTGRTELDSPPSEGIRLLATQMAVAGESVVAIERRLRADFGVTDADLVVQELFGSSGDPR